MGKMPLTSKKPLFIFYHYFNAHGLKKLFDYAQNIIVPQSALKATTPVLLSQCVSTTSLELCQRNCVIFLFQEQKHANPMQALNL